MRASMKRAAILAMGALVTWTWGTGPAAALNPPGLENYDHFMCYQVKETKKRCLVDPSLKCKTDADCPSSICFTGFVPATGLPIEDQFGAGTFDVKAPKDLCLPADKNGEDPGAEAKPGHLKRYQIKGLSPHVKQQVNLRDQFADEFGRPGFAVETIKEDTVMVPTGKNLAGVATELPEGFLDHFKCYKAKHMKNVCLGNPALKCKRDKVDPLIDDCPPGVGPCTPGFPKGVVASVTDQFQVDRPYDVKKLTKLCNPANKNGEDPSAPGLDIHYACYQAKPVVGQPKFTPVTAVRTANQFGPEALEAVKERELCVPALKNPCGDGIMQAGVDECDDGNPISTDGCTDACTICGNNTTTGPEECDDGDLQSGDGCDANCTVTGCGNTIVTAPETCDDGNNDNNDDCPADCIVDACDPLTGTDRPFQVTISSGDQAASVTVLLDYPEGQISIPGSGGAVPPGTIDMLPFLSFSASNDLDHALRQLVTAGFPPLTDGVLFQVHFQDCDGATPPVAPGDFTCTVLEAFDEFSAPLVGVTCSVQ
jgi:cysteine-rich repeat protein